MKISEVRNNTFYQFPQWLLDKRYKNLSLRAKVVYMLVFDRRTLSVQNKWHDRNGEVFVYFTIEELMDKLSCSRQSVINAKKELSNYGLIREDQQGVNRPNRIYINGSLENRLQEVQKLDSGSLENRLQEVQKLDSIKTDNIKTNISILNEPEGAGDKYLYSIEDASPQNDLGIVHDWIFSEFGRYPTPFEIEDLKSFLQDHSKEVIKLAIKECVGNGKPYFKYLDSILRDWKQKGLTTVELVENRQKPKRSNRKSGRLTLDDDGYNPRYGF